MNDGTKPVQEPDDVRSEYAAVVDYHGSLVNSRFTIAGLYVAAVGFIASAILAEDSTWVARVAGAFLACWLTICLWILELRSRALYVNLAQRGIDIEHHNFRLVGSSWYAGFFSRQYKKPPAEEVDKENVPSKPGLDRPKIAWMKAPVSERLSGFISHSWGFDLLYAGSGAFWSIVLILAVCHLVADWWKCP